jgi:HK97 gp10 family phage protein
MKADVNITGLEGVLATLKSLPPEVVSKRGGPVSRALRRAANVIRDEAKRNVPIDTGTLRDAITVSRKKPSPGENGEKFLVWLGPKFSRKYVRNRRNLQMNRYSDTTGAKTYEVDTPYFYGRFLEYGTSKMTARPWMRPAFAAKAETAIITARTELLKEIDKITKKLAQQNKGK